MREGRGRPPNDGYVAPSPCPLALKHSSLWDLEVGGKERAEKDQPSPPHSPPKTGVLRDSKGQRWEDILGDKPKD